jgi:hypothetical protein
MKRTLLLFFVLALALGLVASTGHAQKKTVPGAMQVGEVVKTLLDLNSATEDQRKALPSIRGRVRRSNYQGTPLKGEDRSREEDPAGTQL